MSEDIEDGTIYQVVVNGEEQYSIWPVEQPLPLGWKAAGPRGTKQECLGYIKSVWTDMRPLSLRRAMDGSKARKDTHRARPTAAKKSARRRA